LLAPKGFNQVKRAVITGLQIGSFQHEARAHIDLKNLLQAGDVSAADVVSILKRCDGTQYKCSPHHQAREIDVHIIVTQGWYIKFYFIGNPDTMFISVQR